MRLITDDPGIDLYEVTERTQQWEDILAGMKLGMITADNFSFQERNTVRRFFAEMPIMQVTNPDRTVREPLRVKVVGIANLVEGREWCFATSRDGTFGVFSLDEPSQHYLNGATLHLWIFDGTASPQEAGRVDFTDLTEYLDEAQDAAQGSPTPQAA